MLYWTRLRQEHPLYCEQPVHRVIRVRNIQHTLISITKQVWVQICLLLHLNVTTNSFKYVQNAFTMMATW